MGPRLQERGLILEKIVISSCRLPSMGPRLQERGLPLGVRATSALGKAFNGAALTRARTYRWETTGHRWEDNLQWGRAYKSADLVVSHRWPVKKMEPSMGPRLQERGLHKLLFVFVILFKPSMGPRLQERGLGLSLGLRLLLVWAFNGAALTRARSSPSGRVARVDVSCFNGAALTRARSSKKRQAESPGVINASMGPRLQERGVAANKSPTGISVQRFNGAALTRARS